MLKMHSSVLPLYTVCFSNSLMIIFELILTTIIVIVIFRGCWGSSENWLKLNIEPP